jgi:TolB-like protein/DNA-binding winged helix-turn-helix (wHTH) protein
MLPVNEPKSFRFSDFELLLRSGELFRNGSRVRLNEKPFQVLSALLERPGEVVLRDELRDRLWSADTFVDFDNNLNAAVRKLREALGDSADRPRFIETLPRRGYRFIAAVEATPEAPVADLAGPAVPSVQEIQAEPSRPKVTRFAVIILGLAATLVGLTWLGQGQRSPVAAPPQGKILLAVMPFKNLDGDASRDYFGDGLTEELITQLGRLQPERLGVIAQLSSMSYKGTRKTVETIGQELRADYILESSVRGPGDTVRVTTQLIQVSDQTHLWTETYDRRLADILEIQADIARRVAASLALELLPDEPMAMARAATSVTEAYEQYLRGRHQWQRFNREGYLQAATHFERAIELDPRYPQAYAGLADAYNLLTFDGTTPAEAFPKARQAARQALQLDPDLAEAHNSIGFVRLYYDYDLDGADSAFRRAIEISPNYAMAYHWWAGALSAQGRHDEAVEAVRHSLVLDPVSLSLMSDLGWYYLFADRPVEALDECLRTLEIEPNYGWAKSCRDQALIRLGRLDEFLGFFRQDALNQGLPVEKLTGLDDPDPQVGFAHAARLRFEEQRRQSGGDPVWLAMTYAAAGEIDGAFRLLEQGLENRNPWLVFLRADPRFGPLADDPRFDEMSLKIGLPVR